MKAKANGQGFLAYSILRQLVPEDDRNKQIWLLLSEHSPDADSGIAVRQNLLLLNPSHAEAKVRMGKRQHFCDNPLKLGRLYEEWGEEEKTCVLYVPVAFESPPILAKSALQRPLIP